jgi:hypothetical protein
MIDLAKLKPRLTRPGRTPLSGVPQGLDAMLLPLIAKAVANRVTVHVAVDDQRAAVLADQLAYFDPKLEVLRFPAWDCLPYDRVSPVADIVARRLATLARLLEPVTKPLWCCSPPFQPSCSAWCRGLTRRGAELLRRARKPGQLGPAHRLPRRERLLAHRNRGGPRRLRGAGRHPRHLPAGLRSTRAPRFLRRHAGIDPQLRS